MRVQYLTKQQKYDVFPHIIIYCYTYLRAVFLLSPSSSFTAMPPPGLKQACKHRHRYTTFFPAVLLLAYKNMLNSACISAQQHVGLIPFIAFFLCISMKNDIICMKIAILFGWEVENWDLLGFLNFYISHIFLELKLDYFYSYPWPCEVHLCVEV